MLRELRAQLDAKKISSVELTKQYLERIKEKNPTLNAYVNITESFALEQAAQADAKIAKQQVGPLTGIPYAAKDVYCIEGIETTACSNILKGYIPPYTATSVKRLGDAVLLGKANTDEFTMGSSTESSCFGVTRNPHDPTKVAGGSSGGPAAAVAADLAAFSLGTDTGGSIRQPAAFCGVAGLRPTYGRVPRYGVISMASSLDTVGPIAKTVEDIAILMELMSGQDAFDGTTAPRPVEQYTQLLKVKTNMTIGIPKEFTEVAGLHPDIQQCLDEVAQRLQAAGHTLKTVSMPHTKYAMPAYYIICPCEVSSTTARYDGIKYGFRAFNADELIDIYKQSRSQGFGPEVKRRIMIGTYALSAGYYDAYYLKAMKVRTIIAKEFAQVFADGVDVLLAPVTPSPAFTVGEKINDPIAMYLEDVFTIPSSLAGLPGLSIPCGMSNNLPIGLQVIGPQWSEPQVLQLGHQIEQLQGVQ